MEPYYTPTHLVRNNISHGSLDKAGEDDIDPDAELAELLGRGLGEADNPRLAGGVVGLADVAGPRHDTGDVHDRPRQLMVLHQTCRCLSDQKCALEIDINDLVKVFFLHPEHEPVLGYPRRVDNDVWSSLVLVKNLLETIIDRF